MRIFDIHTGPVIDGHVRVMVVGEVDIAVTDLVREVTLTACRAVGVAAVEVDLSRTSLLDASGIGALLAAREAAAALGRTLRVHGASGVVREVLEITGSLSVLDTKADDDRQHLRR